jgi:isoleucyl-tRNA synthetase
MRSDGRVEIAGIILDPHDFELRLHTTEELVAEPFDAWRGVVVLDTNIYRELQAEGWARDFVRLVQNTRKRASLEAVDRINIAASVSPELVHALREHVDYIKHETLAVRVDLASDVRGGDAGTVEEDIDHHYVRFRIERAAA